MFKETHARSLSKAISWRILATFTTMLISFFITGNVKYAISIGSIEFFAKLFLFYGHERAWNFLRIGKQIKCN